MGTRLLLPIALAIGLIVMCSATAATAAGGGQSSQSRTVLQGSKPSWTAVATRIATVAAGKPVRARVWLAPRNAAQLDALAQAVSDPTSAQYGQFISDAQYNAQFAPTGAQVSAAIDWLAGAGLQISSVGPDNQYLAVAGSAASMNTAFGTQLGTYAMSGKPEQAPTTNLSVPSTVADSVLAVSGLSTFGHKVKPADLGPEPAFVNATPCSSYYDQLDAWNLPRFDHRTLPYAVCGYVPSQLRGAYGEDPSGGSSLGRGATVAITDAFDSPRLKQDANTYSQRHGDDRFAPSQFQDRSAPESSDPDVIDACGGNGWYGEQQLDVEAVHGMAPGANVLYYGATSCFDDDLLAELSQIVHDNDASIVTNSWGDPTFFVDPSCPPPDYICSTIDQNLVNAYESVFKHGAVQGIGFYFSSGDAGDDLDEFGVKHPEFPTGDPWVTSVGGTSLAVDRKNRRSFETGWGTSKWALSADSSSWVQTVPFLYGAGGGFSQVFPQPWYQKGVVRNNPTGGRAVPDIGMVGDPTTGMLVGETQDFDLPSRYGPAGIHYGEYRIGGTSLSSPLMAGVQAVAQGRSRIGFANPLIYGLLSRGVYYDVTPQGDEGNARADFVNGENADDGIAYSVRTFDQDSSLMTGRGWDDVTGVGAPTSRYFDQFDGWGHH